MSVSYERAFALRDNPFGPVRKVPGVTSPKVLRNLARRPLRVHEEPALMDLYCPDAGPFRAHVDRFTQRMMASGYSDSPPALGYQSDAFLIAGPQGSGKSTLVNVMVSWLLHCAVNSAHWTTFELPGERITLGLRDELISKTGEDDHCIVVVDDVTESTMPEVESFHLEYESTRALILFIITSDTALLRKSTTNNRVGPTRFDTAYLTADAALEYTAHRMAHYRTNPIPAIVDSMPLFPFTEAIIREAVVPDGSLPANDTIALRQLNVALCEALLSRLPKIANGFDVSLLDPDEVGSHLLPLGATYEGLVGNVASQPLS